MKWKCESAIPCIDLREVIGSEHEFNYIASFDQVCKLANQCDKTPREILLELQSTDLIVSMTIEKYDEMMG